MQSQFLAVIIKVYVSKRHVADNGVDATFGQLGVAKTLDADILVGMEGTGDAAGDGIEFHTNVVVFLLLIETHEVADAAARFQNRGPIGHAQMGNGVMDGLHDDG